MLLELKLRGILDRDDALAVGDISGQDVEQRGFARSGSARDQDVDPGPDDPPQKLRHRFGDRAQLEEVLDRERALPETADREDRAV